ncbi:hypothetical protein FS837_010330 [Tulasnella sp. UAMH 9824]|nr:hypothetical protein FS837_010330 [Tulasnella sp. UAMH 9824]
MESLRTQTPPNFNLALHKTLHYRDHVDHLLVHGFFKFQAEEVGLIMRRLHEMLHYSENPRGSVWLDENTRRKIHALSHNQLHLLSSEIPAEQISKRYGGGLDWELDDSPSLDGGKVPKWPWEIRGGKAVLGRDLAREKGEAKVEEVKSER